ncbi:MAG: hypothetical protein ACOCWM_00580 [Cyclobacteriaceae bacterium]
MRNIHFVINNRYLFTSIILLIVIYVYVFNSRISVSDFWEHTAVIKSLSKDIFSPSHPLINVDNVSHAFFSPYHILLSIFAKSFNVVNLLKFFGVINLAFLLVSIWFFIKEFFNKNYDTISFYSILMILLLWGIDPWRWSGFFHIKILVISISYPSTFSAALMFISAYVHIRFIKNGNLYLIFPVLIISAIILITHPTTYVVHCVLLFSLTIHFTNKIFSKYLFITIFIILIGSALLSLLWPYYSYLEIIKDSETLKFNDHSKALYENILLACFPWFISLPFLVKRIRRNILDFFVLIVFILSSIYIFGYISGIYGFGRVISYIAVFMQILLAYEISYFELSKVHTLTRKYLFSIIIVFVLLLLNLSRLYDRFFVNDEDNKIELSSNKNSYSINNNTIFKKGYHLIYEVLPDYIGEDDLVISDLYTSWFIPTYAGKVIASKHPVYWIDDAKDRRDDLDVFFSEQGTLKQRRIILNKYNPDYMVINLNRTPEKLVNDFIIFGSIIYQSKDLIIVEL